MPNIDGIVVSPVRSLNEAQVLPLKLKTYPFRVDIKHYRHGDIRPEGIVKIIYPHHCCTIPITTGRVCLFETEEARGLFIKYLVENHIVFNVDEGPYSFQEK